jgi:hypothetical protein
MRRLWPLPLLLLLAPSAALAQGGPPNSLPAPEEDDSERPLIPDASDVLGGHVLAGIAPIWSLPFGTLESRLPAADRLASGFGARADLGFGVSRTVVLGVTGDFSSYLSPDDCDGCGGQSFGVGPMLRDHLVQGTRFDPWVSIGAGFRSLSVDGGDEALDLTGVDWLRVAFGGDYYPLSNFALGPFAGFDATTYTGGDDDSRISFQLTLGLRLALNVPGK